jgi:ferric-dicitrate binding protein FerR (iron transport regulator)
MSNTSPDDLQRISDWLAGQSSPAEARDVQTWITAAPGRDTLVTRLLAARTALREDDTERAAGIAQGVQARVRSAPGGASANANRQKEQRERGRFGVSWVKVMRQATIPMTVMLATVVLTTVLIRRAERPGISMQTRTYATAPGQTATVSIGDGASAILAPATTLTVMPRSANGAVQVRIEGKALFTVAHDTKNPFVVHTRQAIAKVLGTTFSVQHYADDSQTRVAVREGRISLRGIASDNDSRRGSILTAHMLGTIGDSGIVRVTPGMLADEITAWTQGRLVFRDTPARDAMKELGRVYDVELRIPDSVRAEQRINWTVPVTQRSLSDVLESLGDVLDAHPVRKGKVITFVAGRSIASPSRTPRTHSPSEPSYGK